MKVFNKQGKEIYYRKEEIINLPPKILEPKQVGTFNNKILHPEDKLARKPIINWIEEINLSLKMIDSKESVIERIEEIAIIYNQSTYIMAAIGDFQNAYKFCHDAILLFDCVFNDSFQANYLFYGIQPWINLIRLDRICKAESDAIDKLELLRKHKKQTASIYEIIIAKALQLNLPRAIVDVINNAYFSEKLKIFLQLKQYQEIPHLKKYSHINAYHLSVIAEGEIIALNHLKECDKAFSIAVNEYKNGQPIAMPVFLYRIIELISKEQTKQYKLIDTMTQYIRRKLNTNNYSLYDLFFMYESYKYIFSYFEEYRDLKLLLLFSSAFSKKNDEPGRIDSLYLASSLDRKYSEDLNEQVNDSGYFLLNPEAYKLTRNTTDYNRMLQKLESLHSYL